MNDTYGAARLPKRHPKDTEWVTVGLFVACYGAWALALFGLPIMPAIPVLVLSLVMHASLTHEVCHGHPFPSRRMSEALVHINPGLAVPYLRFRDTHLAHHQDSLLTDPYDDPESNYLDPAAWQKMPKWLKAIRRINNTLAGRMIIGPLLGQVSFMTSEFEAIRLGYWHVLRAWVFHIPGVAAVLTCVWISDMSLWTYLLCAYAALSVLKIRTFLEHQAHETTRGRTVVIEDRGILAFLFLNNNLHVVHHMNPHIAWYQLPQLYRAQRDRFLRRNDGYQYASYGEIFRAYLFRTKDPVPHPLWPSAKD